MGTLGEGLQRVTPDGLPLLLLAVQGAGALHLRHKGVGEGLHIVEVQLLRQLVDVAAALLLAQRRLGVPDKCLPLGESERLEPAGLGEPVVLALLPDGVPGDDDPAAAPDVVEDGEAHGVVVLKLRLRAQLPHPHGSGDVVVQSDAGEFEAGLPLHHRVAHCGRDGERVDRVPPATFRTEIKPVAVVHRRSRVNRSDPRTNVGVKDDFYILHPRPELLADVVCDGGEYLVVERPHALAADPKIIPGDRPHIIYRRGLNQLLRRLFPNIVGGFFNRDSFAEHRQSSRISIRSHFPRHELTGQIVIGHPFDLLAQVIPFRLLLASGPRHPVEAVFGRPAQHPLEG